jgi:putative phosphoribosyl transferase
MAPRDRLENWRRFADRREAGVLLASELTRYAGRDDVIVLALPRGGVPVGYEVAKALNAPLDVFVVRKLGLPEYPELAMGAIATGGVRILNPDVLAWHRPSERAIDAITQVELAELKRREREYRGERPPARVEGKVAILVDDGLATGSTMRAGVQSLRRLNPARIVVAVPVGARESVDLLRSVADEVVCPFTPEPFSAVGLWYANFAQTTDEEVRRLLAPPTPERARSQSG